jgi:hypothetical protein
LEPSPQKRGPAAWCRWAVLATALVSGLVLAPAAQAAPPTVGATWGTEVTATSFRANAIVNPGSLSTSYRFDYIASSTYEANVAAGRPGFEGASRIPIGAEAKIFASAADQEVFQRVGGLSGDTGYRYRIVVRNAEGEVVGPERTVRTQEANPDFSIAEGRGWEMVSPVEKNGGSIIPPEALFGGGEFQASTGGSAIAYSSPSSFGDGAGNPAASQYLATRGSSGWSSQNLTLATEASAFGTEPDGVPFRLFATDLSRALVLRRPHEFLLLGGSGMQQLASLAGADVEFAGATPDLSHLVFSTCEALTPDAIEVPGGGGGCDPSFPNLYELSADGSLRLLNIEPGLTQGTPGAALAAQAGAISADGSRVFWTDDTGSLLVRDGARTVKVDDEAEFQIAADDGSIAYFTKNGPSNSRHLFRYSLSGESSVDLTPGGGVLGVLGASANGSHVYFVDGGGVELWDGGSITPVAAESDPSSYPPATGTARVSRDGTKLVFLASDPLIGYDSNGQNELYRYDASSKSFSCVSCNPTGARALGATSIPGAVANGTEVRFYKPRVMDEQGNRVFFDTLDSLTPKDANGEVDVYEWRAVGVGGCGRPEGCVGLISSGKGADGASFVDASADGTDVYFLTDESLVGDDPGSTDLYDARIGGGFPEPPAPIPCFGDACQPLPPEPEDPTPGTGFVGEERNSKLTIEGSGAKKHKHRRHHKRHAHRKHHHHGRRSGKRVGGR